ncbi:MAG: hypothetical protein J6R84_04145, partial [Alistipes sp.]|nr:hypothetical protein [Alistipes sp.]
VWAKCLDLLNEELKKGVLDVETKKVSGICNFAPGYIDKENEVIVGLQTDAPLKRIVNLYGGTRMAEQSLKEYGYELDPTIKEHFTEYRKTHNQGVFDAYPPSVRKARSAGLITGLPDAYGRGRIIGDYRRIPLYGTDRLIKEKMHDLEELDDIMDDLVGLLLLAALLYGVKRILEHYGKSFGTIFKPAPPLPPHEEAFAALERLRVLNLCADGKHKLYYSTLTDILRTYIVRRFDVGAMEMTSDEIIEAMRGVELQQKQSMDLTMILREADLVKFAKAMPESSESEAAMRAAWEFVDATKPVEEIAQEEE